MATQFLKHKEESDFMIKEYLPQLNKVVKENNVSISFFQKLTMIKKFTGMIMKIGYAFLWQEYEVNFPALYDESTLQMGAQFAPYFNMLSNVFGGFPQTDEYINQTSDVYPGDTQCRGYSPHALWHE